MCVYPTGSSYKRSKKSTDGNPNLASSDSIVDFALALVGTFIYVFLGICGGDEGMAGFCALVWFFSTCSTIIPTIGLWCVKTKLDTQIVFQNTFIISGPLIRFVYSFVITWTDRSSLSLLLWYNNNNINLIQPCCLSSGKSMRRQSLVHIFFWYYILRDVRVSITKYPFTRHTTPHLINGVFCCWINLIPMFVFE